MSNNNPVASPTKNAAIPSLKRFDFQEDPEKLSKVKKSYLILYVTTK
jgi:hypothetical protein